MRPIRWHLEKQLEGTTITRKGDTRSQIAPPPSKVVVGGKQCASRSTIDYSLSKIVQLELLQIRVNILG